MPYSLSEEVDEAGLECQFSGSVGCRVAREIQASQVSPMLLVMLLAVPDSVLPGWPGPHSRPDRCGEYGALEARSRLNAAYRQISEVQKDQKARVRVREQLAAHERIDRRRCSDPSPPSGQGGQGGQAMPSRSKTLQPGAIIRSAPEDSGFSLRSENHGQVGDLLVEERKGDSKRTGRLSDVFVGKQ